MRSVKTGDKVELPGAIEDTEGYTFTGWKLEDGTVIAAGSGEEITVRGNMVITAQFTQLEYLSLIHI